MQIHIHPPDQLHHLVDTDGRMGFLNVDARSRDVAMLRVAVTVVTPAIGFDVAVADRLAPCLRELADGLIAWKEARDTLFRLLERRENSGPSMNIVRSSRLA